MEIANATANPTTGQVVFRMSKMGNFNISIPANMTTTANVAVDNSDWTMTGNGFFYTFASTRVTAIGANSSIKIGFVLTATGNSGSSGAMTITILNDTGGSSAGNGDSNNSNNTTIQLFDIN